DRRRRRRREGRTGLSAPSARVARASPGSQLKMERCEREGWMKDDNSQAWLAVACFCVIWAIWAVFSGACTGVAMPALIGAGALLCHINQGVRRWVTDKLSWAFSGSSLRLVLVMIGVMMLWQ